MPDPLTAPPAEYLSNPTIQEFAQQRGMSPADVWKQSSPSEQQQAMELVRLSAPRRTAPVERSAVPREYRSAVVPGIGQYSAEPAPPRRLAAPPAAPVAPVEPRPSAADRQRWMPQNGIDPGTAQFGDAVPQPVDPRAMPAAAQAPDRRPPSAAAPPERMPQNGIDPGSAQFGNTGLPAGLAGMRLAGGGEPVPPDAPPPPATAEEPSQRVPAARQQLSFGVTGQQAAQAVGQTAPATAAALQQGAQRLSVQNVPGRAPTQSQYRRAASDTVQYFVNDFGPQQFMRLMDQGRFGEAFAWKEYYESKDAKEQVDHFSRTAFAAMAGDTRTAVKEFSAAVRSSPVADMYEIVESDSRIFGQERSAEEPYARVAVRNRATGEVFQMESPSEEDFFAGIAEFASAESAFDRRWAEVQGRVNALRAQMRDDEAAIQKLASDILKNDDGLGLGDTSTMTPQQALEVARELVDGARKIAQSGLGSLGYSQGGRRDSGVPSVGAP